MSYTLDPSQGIGRHLFDTMGPTVAYSLQHCGNYLTFTVDPYWDRVVFVRNGWQVGAYGSTGPGAGQFNRPSDIDIYYNGIVAIADTDNDRIRFLSWLSGIVYNPASQTPCTTTPGSSPVMVLDYGFLGPSDGYAFSKPQGVSVDDGGTPAEAQGYNTDDVVWVADTGNNRIVQLYVNWGPNPPVDTQLGSYGTTGSGVGQFLRPRRAVRGRVATGSDTLSSRNTSDLYILDSGNNRVVRLNCPFGTSVNQATWLGSVPIPGDATNLPQSIAVDGWGNLYVTDARHSVVHKFSANLELLASYGQFGYGVKNGQIARPIDFRPHFRKKNWTTPPRLETTTFALLTEYWGDQSGGQGYFLGVQVDELTASSTPGAAWVKYKLTHNAFLKVEILDEYGSLVKLIDPGTTFHASGRDSVYWDGRRSNGSIAPGCGAYSVRATPRTAHSMTFDATEARTANFSYCPAADLTLSYYVPQGGAVASPVEGTDAISLFRACPNNHGGTSLPNHARIKVAIRDQGGSPVTGIPSSAIRIKFNGGSPQQGFAGEGADSIIANTQYNPSDECPNVTTIPADAPTDAAGVTYITFTGASGTPGVGLRDPARKWGHWDSELPVFIHGGKLQGRLTTASANGTYSLQIKNYDFTYTGLGTQMNVGEQVRIGEFNYVANNIGATPSQTNPLAWWADFNNNGEVDGSDYNLVNVHMQHDCNTPIDDVP